jgi:sugar lactone lactonase YvrE
MSRTGHYLALALTLAACGDDPAPQPDIIALPGDAYYPESLSASADGTLFVGSLTTGQVTAFANGDTAPRTVVGAGSGVTGVAGVLVHDEELWICSIDPTFQRATEVKSFALDGTAHDTFSLGANRFCNDMAFDDAGSLYVTDSFSGTVLRLAAGGNALEPWLVDPSLAPAMQGAFGLDGIAFDGAGGLYLDKLDTSGLYRVAIQADGSAGAATPIAVTPALASPDGMRVLDAHTLLVIEGPGRLSKVTVNGATATATALADDLDMPTGVVKTRGFAWVSEGQLGRLFAQPPVAPMLPFAIRRVDL